MHSGQSVHIAQAVTASVKTMNTFMCLPSLHLPMRHGTGQAPVAWAIGARCQAYSTIDGQWYLARVTGVSAAGQFVVQLEQGGPEEEVSPPTHTRA